jgi:LacI family transcriptional regulator
LRLRGYKAALKEHGIPFDPAYVKQGLFEFESGLAAARQLLALPKRPTAIFASNDDMAAGALMAAHEMNVAVPATLSVVGFDDTYVARIVWPPLTTVHQPTYDLAYAATDLLLHTLRNDEGPKFARLPYRLIIRDSTGPVATS